MLWAVKLFQFTFIQILQISIRTLSLFAMARLRRAGGSNPFALSKHAK